MTLYMEKSKERNPELKSEIKFRLQTKYTVRCAQKTYKCCVIADSKMENKTHHKHEQTPTATTAHDEVGQSILT